jgi:hypothetical protein
MISHDYGQLSHLSIDPNNQYPFPTQQSLYTSMMTYPTQPMSYSINSNGGNFQIFS